MAQATPSSVPRIDAADYQPEADVERLAAYFARRYGSLEAARKALDPKVSFELGAFERALKKWGVQVDNVVELFDHIDVDWSGTVSVQELLDVLGSPVAEIKRREQERQRNEVHKIFDSLARCIRTKFGSVPDAFAKHGLHRLEAGSSCAALSLAQFHALVKTLDIELGALQLQRVFNEIDADRTGLISVEELQRALGFHMVRHIILDLAAGLTKRFPSVASAFESIGEIAPGAMSAVPQPTAPAEAHASLLPPPPAAPPGETYIWTDDTYVTEEKLSRLLRQLKANLTDPTVKMLHESLVPFTVKDLVLQMQDELQLQEAQDRRQEEDKERRANAQQNKLADTMPFESQEHVEKEVRLWLEEALASQLLNPRPVTAKWNEAARAGKAKAQLKDYASALDDLLKDRAQVVTWLKAELSEELREVEGLKKYFGPAASRAGTISFDERNALKVLGGLCSIPETSPRLQDAMQLGPKLQAQHLDASMQHGSKAFRAERFLQAAAAGDVEAVERCLDNRADVNVAAWGGVTALMGAARHGRLEVLQLLLVVQADPLRTDLHGRTALDHAQKQGSGVRDWLRGHGVLGRHELDRMVQYLGTQLIKAEEQRKKLERMREQVPSEEVLQRARLRQRLAQQAFQESNPVPGQAPLFRSYSDGFAGGQY